MQNSMVSTPILAKIYRSWVNLYSPSTFSKHSSWRPYLTVHFPFVIAFDTKECICTMLCRHTCNSGPVWFFFLNTSFCPFMISLNYCFVVFVFWIVRLILWYVINTKSFYITHYFSSRQVIWSDIRCLNFIFPKPKNYHKNNNLKINPFSDVCMLKFLPL